MKGSNKKILIISLLILLAVIIGVGFYFLRPVSPKETFVKGISSAIDYKDGKFLSSEQTTNTTISLSGNIETQNEEMQEMVQYINDGKIMFNIQTNPKSKKALILADVDYKNESLLSTKVFYQNDDNIYLYVQDLFDKYFKYNLTDLMKDQGTKETIEQLFIGNTSEKKDTKKASNIIKSVISENLKDEYFSKENTEGMTKNTMKLPVKELKELLKNTLTKLRDNQEFLNCFEKQESIKNVLEKLINQVDEIKDVSDSDTLEISIFTKGITKEFQKIEISASKKEEKIIEITIKNEKVDNDTEKFIIETNEIKDLGKIILNVEIKNSKNTDIDNVDVSNSININEMSTEDTIKLYTNLTKMKLYKYISPLLIKSSITE